MPAHALPDAPYPNTGSLPTALPWLTAARARRNHSHPGAIEAARPTLSMGNLCGPRSDIAQAQPQISRHAACEMSPTRL